MANVGQTLVRLVGALFLAAGATRVDHPSRLETGALADVQTAPVVVAARHIPAGVIIDRGALTAAQWPGGTIPAGAYVSVDSAAHRVSRIAILKGEAIVPGRLAPPGATAGHEVEVTLGKRAYDVRVDDGASIVGLVQPNSRVDIVLVTDDGESGAKGVARPFISNVRVLSIGALVQRAAGGRVISPVLVTIEIAPEEAEMLAAATSRDRFRVVPHSPDPSGVGLRVHLTPR